ncbi:AraC family transcriptional regulator [Pontibacter diazotrophicus]|uniref:AraC family transcriptional regulator n=1 Tax=Pontibacter diazotrophicus TaxID=1400979 RepID=A0A3D8LDT2_9BACT|nr:AraC family transcriptional regulator [Pontibacter diazotrophicus]RDV15434.1 AraC family transcriptional regulator [Pontibacter diazotrophicus]
MRRYIQYEPFNIYLFDTSKWEHPVHKHSYFEIIFIRSGRGLHVINNNTVLYTAGDVFLLGPEDYHYFDIQEHTTFCYIRFTEVYIKDETLLKVPDYMRTIAFILNSPYQCQGTIVSDSEEKEHLDRLLSVLLYEYSNRGESSYELIMHSIMQAMLGILARNMVRQKLIDKKKTKSSKLIEDIMLYISQHIYEPEALRMERLVEKFNFSNSYLSIFFKKQTGESLQQYILKYKLKMIESRLQSGDRSISQIAYEFGFTDGSHLNKLFKKYYGVAPGAFKAKQVAD